MDDRRFKEWAMSKKANEIKNALAVTSSDPSGEIGAAAGQVQAILRGIHTPSLDDRQQGELHAIRTDLDGIVQRFRDAREAQAPTVEHEAKQLKTANTIRVSAFIALLVLAVVLLMSTWQTAILLGIVAIVGNIVARNILASKGKALAHSAYEPAGRALHSLGRPAYGTQDATGLAGRADHLFLSSLGHNALLMEQQRRQMEAMRAQHEQQMAQQREAMRQQQAAMNRLVDEQQMTNDALYGRPGFFGSAVRGYDAAKRNRTS